MLLRQPEALAPEAPYTTEQYVVLCLGSCCFLAALRILLDATLFQPLGRRVVLTPKEQQMAKLAAKKQQAVDKFTESLWKFVVYTALWSFGLFALHDKEWLWDTSGYWRGMPQQLQSARVHQLYFVQTGFYVSSVFMLQYWETRRKDYPVMITHHFTTLTLLVASYALGFMRVGSVILLLHDFNDILLELAKLFNYAKWEAPSMAAFGAMMLSWVCLRLYLLPCHIVWSCLIEHQAILGHRIPYYYPLNALLLALVAMHIYWFGLIIKVAIGAIKGDAKDVREDDD